MQLGGIKVSGGKVESGALTAFIEARLATVSLIAHLPKQGTLPVTVGVLVNNSLLSPLPVTYLPRAWLSLLICPQYLLNIMTLENSPPLACTTSHISKGSQCRPTFVSQCPHLWVWGFSSRKKRHCTLYFLPEPLQGAPKFT